ncbi:hypothetical protein P8936_12700 [Edaphobacter paludis]|uniref:Uncharacterized protein n=1 Tax=Edaphobacter paludis TaxID=3035702 RepID=A0AAU7CW69_9BACT
MQKTFTAQKNLTFIALCLVHYAALRDMMRCVTEEADMNPTRKLCVLMLLCASSGLVAQSSDASKPAANAVEKKADRKASQDEVPRRSKLSEHDKSTMLYDKAPAAAAPAAAAPAPAAPATAAASPRPYTAQSSGDDGAENTTPVPVGTTPPTPKQDTK